MPTNASYGLEQARIQLPTLVAKAHAGVASVITRHGKPYAAIVSIQDLEKSSVASGTASSVLALSGTGRGLWGTSPGQSLDQLRGEWGDA